MKTWEERLKWIEECPYYELSVEEFKPGLKCQYHIVGEFEKEFCYGGDDPEGFRVFGLELMFDDKITGWLWKDHIVTEDDMEYWKEDYLDKGHVPGLYRGIKSYKL